ncbi:hypothetical protein PDIG_02330 [Penicillium digitatum PHI26]|uniref:Uncharacterized protein n=2 Tax=Penicillium digitatum TaxID=36651 RepID=K9GER6_PEND2|nr:hypothetical protein PDIP_13620 [Penicillium digitatum Pd1]EKV19539.1 hypothetical protein PDIG_02330 [Penicillium digitatum PHI26]EKV20715.1 hypothetical protein PDIP_13620 [Penicillium digitatum Pd1]
MQSLWTYHTKIKISNSIVTNGQNRFILFFQFSGVNLYCRCVFI